jgi:hypothetical protein
VPNTPTNPVMAKRQKCATLSKCLNDPRMGISFVAIGASSTPRRISVHKGMTMLRFISLLSPHMASGSTTRYPNGCRISTTSQFYAGSSLTARGKKLKLNEAAQFVRMFHMLSPDDGIMFMMEKLLGIMPYVYFFDELVQLGNVTFIGMPDFQGRNHAPVVSTDRQFLKELSRCFSTTRGLSTDVGGTKAVTYFLLESGKGKETEILEEARKALTLLRYAMLRPDTQALDNVESTYLYAFALPPVSSDDYRTYQCWPNLNLEQEIWVSPKHEKFPLPGWYVDFQLVHTSQVEDLEEIEQVFYGQGKLGKVNEIILAMDWYNQSFLGYSLRNISGRLVDIATAFETLFQLPRRNKTVEFKKRIKEYLGAEAGSILDNWATDFYSNVRSETVHRGKPVSFLFKHPEAQTPHLSFLLSSQQIFRECISAKAGLPRHTASDRMAEQLIPNEVHLDKLRKAGSFEKILADNMLGEVGKLRAVYPAGKRDDIIWLGKELLRGYKELYKPSTQSLPTLDSIVISGDVGTELGLRYYRFLEEFRPIYPDSYIAVGWGEPSKEATRKLKVISGANIKQMQLEGVIYGFARFAGWALLLPP